MIPSEVLKHVRRIHIKTRHMVNQVIAGQYHSVFKGRGMEFDEVREYQPGDDVRTIDWNVTARTGQVYIKKFVEERELTVMIILDASGSGIFGSHDKYKREYAAELASVLAFSAIENNDKVGLIIFTDKVEKYIPPKKGKKHVLRVIRDILFFNPDHAGTNIQDVLKFTAKILKRKSVCFLISDFYASGYEKELELMNKRHDLIAISVTDPREYDIPPVGIVEFEDMESNLITLIDTRDKTFQSKYNQQMEDRVEERNKFFRSRNIDYIDLRTNQEYLIALMKFFTMRKARRRFA